MVGDSVPLTNENLRIYVQDNPIKINSNGFINCSEDNLEFDYQQ